MNMKDPGFVVWKLYSEESKTLLKDQKIVEKYGKFITI